VQFVDNAFLVTGRHPMINRRTWLRVAVLSALLITACAVPPLLSARHRTSLARALLQVQTSRSEAEVTDRLGPPNGTGIFDPGSKAHPVTMNYFSREKFSDFYVAEPPDLFQTLPTKARLIYYMFEYSPHVMGDLNFAVDGQGLVLGWFYSTALKSEENEAGLIDHN